VSGAPTDAKATYTAPATVGDSSQIWCRRSGAYNTCVLKHVIITVDSAPVEKVASSGIDWDCPWFKPTSADRPADGTCTPPTWVGTSSIVAPHVISLDASVMWKVDPDYPGPPGSVGYYADGSLTMVFQEYLDLGCTVSPTQFTIGKMDGDINE